MRAFGAAVLGLLLALAALQPALAHTRSESGRSPAPTSTSS